MLKTGTGSLKDVFGRKHTKTDNENEEWSNAKYIKYPVTSKTTLEKSSSVEDFCEICESISIKLANLTCLECKQSMCSTCAARHRNMRSSMFHHFVNTALDPDALETDGTKLCTKHQKANKTFHCLECSETICVYCKVLYHAEHPTHDLLDADSDMQSVQSVSANKVLKDILHSNLPHRSDVFTESHREISRLESIHVDRRNNEMDVPLHENYCHDRKIAVTDPEKLAGLKKDPTSFKMYVTSIDSGLNLNSLRNNVCDSKTERNTLSPVSLDQTCLNCLFNP